MYDRMQMLMLIDKRFYWENDKNINNAIISGDFATSVSHYVCHSSVNPRRESLGHPIALSEAPVARLSWIYKGDDGQYRRLDCRATKVWSRIAHREPL